MSMHRILRAAHRQAEMIVTRLRGSIRTERVASRKTKDRRTSHKFSMDEPPLGFELPELTVLKIGLVLVSLYMLVRVDAIAGGSRDLSWFVDRPADTSLWSASRVHRYNSAATPPPDALAGALIIRSLDLAAPIYVDTRKVHLNRGVGLVAAMATPGEPGNVGIAGHRDGHFRVLKDIKSGDAIEILTRDRVLRYRVLSTSIVERDDPSLLRATQSPTLTLVTCYPFYFVGRAPQRFIVRSELVSSDRRSASMQARR